METVQVSSSQEDYLEAIAEIIENQGHAHAKEIADRLNVKMPSVTSALLALSARGLVEYRPHLPVLLTPSGAETAAVIRHRHAVLKNFFRNILKLPERESNDSACRVEHIVGEKATSRLVVLAEAILQRPDCAGLRKYIEETMPEICPDGTVELISLDKLKVGQRGVVVQVAESLRGFKRFADLGLVKGTLLEMEGYAPFGDLLRIKVMGSSLSLRANDASHIWLKPAGDVQ